MAEGGVGCGGGGLDNDCIQSVLSPATSGEYCDNNIELNKTNEQNKSNTDSSSCCFTTTQNKVNNSSATPITTTTTTSPTLLVNNSNITINNDNDDEDDDESSNQTFYEAAGEPELVLTFEKSLKTTNDVTATQPPPPFPSFAQNLENLNLNDEVQKVQQQQPTTPPQLENYFVSVQPMDKCGRIDDGIDDLDEECEGAVGIISSIKDALNVADEKELNFLLCEKPNDFIKIEEEPVVVMRRKRDKSKFSFFFFKDFDYT